MSSLGMFLQMPAYAAAIVVQNILRHSGGERGFEMGLARDVFLLSRILFVQHFSGQDFCF